MSCFYINGIGLKRYCEDNNIKYSKVYFWINKGLSVEDSIKKTLSNTNYPQTKWIKDGQSVYHICKKNGILYNSVVKFIKKGVSIEKAIKIVGDKVYKRGRPSKYVYDGVGLLSYCKKNNLDYMNVFYYIKKGLSIKEAIERVKNV